jgi:hypothetical protein
MRVCRRALSVDCSRYVRRAVYSPHVEIDPAVKEIRKQKASDGIISQLPHSALFSSALHILTTHTQSSAITPTSKTQPLSEVSLHEARTARSAWQPLDTGDTGIYFHTSLMKISDLAVLPFGESIIE